MTDTHLASFTQDYAAARPVLQAISLTDDVRALVQFKRKDHADQSLADGLWLANSYCAEALSCLPEPHPARGPLLLVQVMLATDALRLELGADTVFLLGDADGNNKLDDHLEAASNALPKYRGREVVEYWPPREDPYDDFDDVIADRRGNFGGL